MNKILIMLKLQQKLNDNTNGIDWEKGFTNKGKKIDWKRCIFIEIAELIDSYPWKHWKDIDKKPDYDNIKIELVDIWHFVLSEILRANKTSKNLSIEELAFNIQKAINNIKVIKEDDFYKEIEEIEKLITKLFCNFEPIEFAKIFIKICYKLNLDLENLYKLYIGKNILNEFRQNNGYKEGVYKKIWNGQEDNIIMQKILENTSNISPKELYQKLEKIYNNLKVAHE